MQACAPRAIGHAVEVEQEQRRALRVPAVDAVQLIVTANGYETDERYVTITGANTITIYLDHD